MRSLSSVVVRYSSITFHSISDSLFLPPCEQSPGRKCDANHVKTELDQSCQHDGAGLESGARAFLIGSSDRCLARPIQTRH